MQMIRIEADINGKSRFVAVELKLTAKGHFGRFSELQAAPGILFREADPGYDSGWHTAPNPLFLIVLSGTIEITTGAGESRVFGPGAVIHAVDVSGQGHRTRCMSSEGFRSILVNLAS